MLKPLRTSLAAIAVLGLVFSGAAPLRAEEAPAKENATTQNAPAESMAGCRNPETGGCCGTCQQEKAEKAEAAPVGCPCQQAKKAQKGS